VDIRAVTDSSNQTSVFTNSGIQLVGSGLASSFVYNSQGTLGASSLYNANPTKSGVGALNIRLPNGANIDLVANNSISSGQIAADLKLRDQTLVQAQTQVDQMAATLASSLSDQTTAGTAVAGPPAGFDVNTSNVVQPGNTINLTYTDSATNTQRQISIVNVTASGALPLQNGANANPLLVGVNFSLGMASVVSQLNTALAANHLQFSNPSPPSSTLRVTDDGSGSATMSAASVTTTVSSLTSGSPQLPLFTDGNSLYTGAINANGPQLTGLAGRISVNAAVVADPSKLSVYSTSPPTATGDNTRSDFLFSQLTSQTFSYSPSTGLGSAAQPFKGTITSYLQQFISQQGNASTLATQLQQGQSVVVSTLQQKFDSTSSVNIDTEMASLIQVQNTYAANAHIMTVVQSMMTSLLQAQV
jgi:flagellar hook-associated protein 1